MSDKPKVTEQNLEAKFAETIEEWIALLLLEQLVDDAQPQIRKVDLNAQAMLLVELTNVMNDVSAEMDSSNWRGYEGRRWLHVVWSKVHHLSKVIRGLNFLYEDVLKHHERVSQIRLATTLIRLSA